jgi:DNA-binding NtrC family response regulator
MFCGYCGNENAEDYNFCTGCGKPLKIKSLQSPSFNQLDRNPVQILKQSLKQSFHVGIPDEGIDLKNLVEQFEKELLIEALEKTGWVKNKAAILLSLNRTTLVEKLKKLNITNPR